MSIWPAARQPARKPAFLVRSEPGTARLSAGPGWPGTVAQTGRGPPPSTPGGLTRHENNNRATPDPLVPTSYIMSSKISQTLTHSPFQFHPCPPPPSLHSLFLLPHPHALDAGLEPWTPSASLPARMRRRLQPAQPALRPSAAGRPPAGSPSLFSAPPGRSSPLPYSFFLAGSRPSRQAPPSSPPTPLRCSVFHEDHDEQRRQGSKPPAHRSPSLSVPAQICRLQQAGRRPPPLPCPRTDSRQTGRRQRTAPPPSSPSSSGTTGTAQRLQARMAACAPILSPVAGFG
jgi:hypothetical protein